MVVKQSLYLATVLAIFAALLACQMPVTNDVATNSQSPIIENANTNKFDLSAFERNRDLWTRQNIPNYKMIVGASGFLANFPEEVLIEVRNRETKSIKSLSKTGNNHIELYNNYSSIEKIFDFIKNAGKPDKLEVIFDGNLGYPKQIIYDERKDIADDELELQVKNLEIIE